ncbi:hypothetical protein CKO_00882 [Citrobacter koseri ATCC BAA-895]|uniref:Uncharacterized protein n=1 Tax=Citrobacter koseri (strain ATCC BAA-895 / CDC 4225-83 / SGSC4696) TaxID=290338 RepID=A8AEW9_CITK8|nr:hypothetical protein CKO_00882 [Citrobacter koseri ATCC BAA-895]
MNFLSTFHFIIFRLNNFFEIEAKNNEALKPRRLLACVLYNTFFVLCDYICSRYISALHSISASSTSLQVVSSIFVPLLSAYLINLFASASLSSER